jgi:hypothetical protein
MTGVSNDSPPADTTERPRAFGSALSINEFAALNQAGVKPLGAVMGCDLESIYVDLPTPPWQPSSRVASKTYGRRFEGDVMAIGAVLSTTPEGEPSSTSIKKLQRLARTWSLAFATFRVLQQEGFGRTWLPTIRRSATAYFDIAAPSTSNS